MRIFIKDLIEVGRSMWADMPSRIALLFCLVVALYIFFGLLITNPPVDWSS